MCVKSLSFTTNYILIHHPRGAIKIKKTQTQKKGSRRKLKACTPTEQQTRRLGTLGRLTDSSAEQGHNCPRGAHCTAVWASYSTKQTQTRVRVIN